MGNNDNSVDCVELVDEDAELCVGDMVRISPVHSYGDPYSDYAYSYHVDIVWGGNLEDPPPGSVMGIILNIYDGYPAISTDNLTDDDVYARDYHYSHHYDFEYLTPKYKARFKWIKLWCVRGDKGIRLVEVDLHNLKVLSGGG